MKKRFLLNRLLAIIVILSVILTSAIINVKEAIRNIGFKQIVNGLLKTSNLKK